MKTRTAVGTLVVALLWHLVIGDGSDVRCLWNTSCLLEANFSIGDDVTISWFQFPEILVHSFSFDADQLKKQNKRFRGRTSLFKENIGKGNASLLLKDVVVEDEGRYMCHVGTFMGINDSFVNLHIEAPVTQIHIHCDGRRLICSSDRIFPRPELRWSTVPALPHGFINTSEVRNETHTKLYNISGWLDLPGDDLPDVEYVCDVSSSRNGGRVTWKKTTVNISDAETSIECASVSDQTSVLWTFNRNYVIASKRAGHKLDIAEHWKKHVKRLSEAGGLHLQALTDQHSGTYTCTLRNATQTRVHDVFLTVMGTEEVGADVVGVVLGVLGALLSVAAVWVIYSFDEYKRSKKEDESRCITVSPRPGRQTSEEDLILDHKQETS